LKSKGNNKELPLHQTLHYRRLREIVTDLCRYESINVSDYNLFNAKAYRCVGDELKGKNVRVAAAGKTNNFSCFVGDNNYEVIEYPKKSNTKSYTGDYLVLIRNRSFDYWLFGTFSHTHDEEKSEKMKTFVERAEYFIYGKYYVLSAEGGIEINKDLNGRDCTFGANRFRYSYFDSFATRKKAYGVSIHQFLANKKGVGNEYNPNAVLDCRSVQIYKKKKKKK
jgi:hypothetical protein